MKMGDVYDVKPFDLHGLVGISDRTLEMHLKLYEGYVQGANQLRPRLARRLKMAGLITRKCRRTRS